MSNAALDSTDDAVQDRTSLVEELRWKKINVLDDGFVCLVDVMGDDSSVVQAARVSYGDGTRKVSDDRTLIRYLMRHWHTTPFEMAEIKLLCRVPMDCWRQWIRHRTANVNEYSTRYSIAIDSAQTTDPTQWRTQAKNNRQGSGDPLPLELGQELTQSETELQEHAKSVYLDRLEKGVAREQARKDLPLATYTEAYWKIDLHNLLHFLYLRMDHHAQEEIRLFAKAIGDQIIKPLFPLVWEAFEDYRCESMTFTRLDIGVMERLAEKAKAEGLVPPYTEEMVMSVQDPTWEGLKISRERTECIDKLRRVGIVA